jgi:membrane protein
MVKRLGLLIWHTIKSFSADGCGRMAAALSYYTIFSLPPLLVLVMLLVGLIVDEQTVRELVTGQIGSLLGPRGAEQVAQLIQNARNPEFGSLTAIVGVVALLLGATGAFTELQSALNTAWGVAPDPTLGGFRTFIFKRLVSFAMILTVGFLLLVSLVVSTLLSALGRFIGSLSPDWVSQPFLFLLDITVSLAGVTLLLAAIFRYLPDAVIGWKDVMVGAVVTGLLFVTGKWAIGTYIGQSDPGSAYGAAGSLVLALSWVYYSAVALLMGAEFTQVWAQRHGRPIVPEAGAARVVTRQERIPPDDPDHDRKPAAEPGRGKGLKGPSQPARRSRLN